MRSGVLRLLEFSIRNGITIREQFAFMLRGCMLERFNFIFEELFEPEGKLSEQIGMLIN